ncbi:hypothetical protein KAFR_0C05570 [Kazachstania africana CBS 2517]|uniref:HIT-type domain-containing protein n=1 Tax=Kazachstania africana (strain ATCC 22294 / BCRC 22015 / CBS 2517 / CECT 1963 / NBRC 1671 / NRRL Y-8276) TaxID=1071382 RepID=H2AT48_KAZAF|nr:hypothetical protein KAFR_0C05570 [Kazachstania africana CBS 2517]CCF57548.1 hypothetical protein KAFR_0C05570 [Kazachstania africana CBS 2517]
MPSSLVEEIDKKTYNPNVYFTTSDPQSYRTKNKVGKSSGSSQFRSVKRVNYSLTDLEARLYATKPDGKGNDNENLPGNNSTNSYLDRYTPQQIMQSQRRFMELNTENLSDLKDIPSLLSSITGYDKDKISSSTSTISQIDSDLSARAAKNKWEIPKSLQYSYKSTAKPKEKKKNTNRIVALKKTLSSKRKLPTYVDTMNQLDKSIIFNNVYNKKYFKVLPLITTCSICGGYDSISSCVNCNDKICSLRCYKLHNETRCTHS